MVTGAFARAFRSAVQPMEIAAALQREVDNSAQILSRDRRLAPNNFSIDLSATDFDRLSTYGETLSRELASMLHEHAAEQHYLFAGPVRLNFSRADDLTTGRFRVRSEAAAEVTPVPGQSMTDTAISRAPMYLEISGVRHPLEAPGVVIGRGTNADLRIDDRGVSRRHAEFRVQQTTDGATVSVLDLGSTNGTTVDGRRVQQSVLADGSVVQIGATRIVVGVPQTSKTRPPAPYRQAVTSQDPQPGQRGGGGQPEREPDDQPGRFLLGRRGKKKQRPADQPPSGDTRQRRWNG